MRLKLTLFGPYTYRVQQPKTAKTMLNIILFLLTATYYGSIMNFVYLRIAALFRIWYICNDGALSSELTAKTLKNPEDC